MTIDTTKLRAAVIARSHDRTHYEGCAYESDHRDCAVIALLDRLAALERVIGREIHGAISAAQEARRMGHKGVAAQLEMIATRMGAELANLYFATETP